MMESDQSALSSLHTLKLDLQMRLCVFVCVWLIRGGYNVTLLCAVCAAAVVFRKHVCLSVFHVFLLAAHTIMMHWHLQNMQTDPNLRSNLFARSRLT